MLTLPEDMDSLDQPESKPELPTQQPAKRKFPWKWFVLAGFIIVAGLWLWFTPPGFMGKMDAIGYAVCHRIDVRSFHFHDRQVPLCARCTGMYLGAVLGIVFQAVQGKRGKYPPLGVIIVLGLLVLAFIIDGSNSYLHFFPSQDGIYEPQNWSRLVTGMGMGLAMAAAIIPAFNQTIWKDWQEKSAFDSWKKLGLLLLLATAIILLVLTESDWVILPAGIISALGVFTLLTMIYTIVVVMVIKRENEYMNLRELIFPLLGGATFTLIQLGAFAYLRYLLTGTWQGFSI